jgi:hypothetical protein
MNFKGTINQLVNAVKNINKMIKRTLQILTTITLFIGLIGCNGISKDEFESLKAQNVKLKQEIEDLKFGPDKLLSKAKIYLEKKEFIKAKSELQILLDKHPTSQQTTEAKQLLEVANSGQKKQKEAEAKEKAEKEKAEKARLANATKKMRVKFDDINNITWYYDKTSPQYSNYNGFYIYIGKKEGSKPWLRLVIQYAADDWLFIDNYIIKVDGQTFNINEDSYGEIKTDNGNGGIWEWLDRKVGSSEFQIIQAIANGKDMKIRFNGKDYYKDKKITEQQKTAIKNVLDAYEALGGTNE